METQTELHEGASKFDQDRIGATSGQENSDFYSKLNAHSLEAISELKISRFLDAIGTNYPENFHKMIMAKVEKPLMKEILKRQGGNQVRSSNILGINRNTLRKKMKMYDINVKH